MTIKNILLSTSIVLAGLSVSSNAHAGAEPLLGEIMEVGFNFCPRGWANADGQLLPISQNTALFSLYGTIYGGDGRTTFALPDLRGRASIHTGHGPGLNSYAIGTRAGAESFSLFTQNMPNHTHRAGINTSDAVPDSKTPKGRSFTTQAENTYSSTAPSPVGAGHRIMSNATVEVESAGGNLPVIYRSPYLTTRKCVAVVGIFPSRN